MNAIFIATSTETEPESAKGHPFLERRELGVRTIFNILGPLTNPADAPNILMGVFHPDLVGIQVRALQRLGAEHAVVVYGKDGMDEVSLGAATMVGELKDGEVTEYEIHPEDFGLRMISNRGLKVTDAAESKEMVLEALGNVEGTPPFPRRSVSAENLCEHMKARMLHVLTQSRPGADTDMSCDCTCSRRGRRYVSLTMPILTAIRTA